jgi:hypothetical protein
MADKISKTNKTGKTVTKRPSKSQRIHARRVKQAARSTNPTHS